MMNWTCEQTEARLIDYIDALLPAAERAAMDLHLATGCDRCTPLLASVSELVTNLHGIEELEEPSQLVSHILDKTLGPRDAVAPAPGFFSWWRGIGLPRLAYGAVSLSATFVMLASVSGFSFRHPKLADLAPANIARGADRQAHLVFARSSKFVSDLRVVYEIQTRLRQDNNEVPSNSDDVLPATPKQAPGSSDGSKPKSPNQQNRANSIDHNLQVLATTITSRELLAGVPRFAGLLLPGTCSGRTTR